MTVKELREYLATMPEYLDVLIQVAVDGSGGGMDFDYLSPLDCKLCNIWGSAAVIRVDYE